MNMDRKNSSNFEIGEIVIMAVAIREPESVGQEREIMGLPAPYKQRSFTGKMYGPGTYSIRSPSGEARQVYPWQLRRRKRPGEVTQQLREAETT